MHDEDGRSPTVMLLALIVVAWLSFFSVAAAQTSVPPMPDPPSRNFGNVHLRGGALARIMNVEIALPQIAWENHLAALAAGDADIAAGATESEARSRYAYFSKPYRTETDVLILPRGTSGRYPFRTIEEMLATFAEQKFRLGIVAGFVYADQRVNAFIADPANRDRIFPVESEVQNLRNLQDGIIDGFIADRIVATTAAWRRNAGSLIEEHPLRLTTDIHFMLSRATQTPQMLARLG
jgi:polar amino acid transport system substrate-binding protein